jgi:hypothetical protein
MALEGFLALWLGFQCSHSVCKPLELEFTSSCSPLQVLPIIPPPMSTTVPPSLDVNVSVAPSILRLGQLSNSDDFLGPDLNREIGSLTPCQLRLQVSGALQIDAEPFTAKLVRPQSREHVRARIANLVSRVCDVYHVLVRLRRRDAAQSRGKVDNLLCRTLTQQRKKGADDLVRSNHVSFERRPQEIHLCDVRSPCWFPDAHVVDKVVEAVSVQCPGYFHCCPVDTLRRVDNELNVNDSPIRLRNQRGQILAGRLGPSGCKDQLHPHW